MTDLKSTYMGLSLKNPIIVGANPMVAKLDNLKKFEDAGAAAVVYKSLFEEQINLESIQLQSELTEYDERDAEMVHLHPHLEHAGPAEHLYNITKAKEALGIPLIASLNCIFQETWIDYAVELAQTGVDGLELNFFATPKDLQTDSVTIEDQRAAILKEIKKVVHIPVSVKLSPFYTNPLNMVGKLSEAGADAFVLFNRLFEPEIDIENQTHVAKLELSTVGDYKTSLRYIGMLYDNINASLCANSGIYEGADAIKLILAGADAVQVVSTIYKNKPVQITKMLNDISSWMEKNNYTSINEFRGKLARVNTKDPFVYKRAQYIDLILRSEDLLKGTPV
jgi:dihydroorotate dehydrogenase (fumarate)